MLADEMPRFTTRAELLAWSQEQVRQFQLDAPYARNQAKLMLAVADRIKHVTLANAAVLETPMQTDHTALIEALNIADLELARCLDMLQHIREQGFYPSACDAEAVAEYQSYLDSAEQARIKILRAKGAQS